MVTQSDNGASKKSIRNEPKIHLCGVIPNKLKHGGFDNRPPLGRVGSFLFCVYFLCLGCVLIPSRLLVPFLVDFNLRVFSSSCCFSGLTKPFPLRRSMQ